MKLVGRGGLLGSDLRFEIERWLALFLAEGVGEGVAG